MQVAKRTREIVIETDLPGWKVRPLLSTLRIATGQVDPKVEPYRSMIMVAPDHIESGTGRLLKKRTARQQNAISGKYMVKAGDIIYSKIRPYLRKAVIADSDCLCSADMYPMTPELGVSSRFMLAVLLGEDFTRFAESVSARTGMPKINRDELAIYQLPLPPCDEQQSIAEVLTDTDKLIESLERLIAKKRDIKDSTMQQLLAGRSRLPGFSNDWKEERFEELFDFSGGVSASRAQLSTDLGYCYLHYGDIHGRHKPYVDVAAERLRIPKLQVDIKSVGSGSLLRDGDVVFVDASEDDEGTSKHIVVRNPANLPFIAGLHTIVAKQKTGEIKPDLLCYCFQNSSIREQFRFYSVGTKVRGVNKTSIKSIKLKYPSTKKEQESIAQILMDMDSELELLESRLAKTRDIRVGMMQQLLTGKVRLV